MNKFSIALLLALCFLLSSCGVISLSYDVTGDGTQKLSDGAVTPNYSKAPSVDIATLPIFDTANGAQKWLDQLPNMDFAEKYFGDNKEQSIAYFSIATLEYAPIFQSADEIAGSVISAALNRVEEKYNIDIINMSYTQSELDAAIKESTLSGRYFADLVSVPHAIAKEYATAEYCEAISSLPYIDQSAPFYVSDLTKYGADFGKYALMSNATYLTKDLCCLYFDTSAVDVDLYSLALSNSLDWDIIIDQMTKTGRGIETALDLADVFRLSVGARYTLKNGNLALANTPFASVEQTKEAQSAALANYVDTLLARKSAEEPIFAIDTLANFKSYTSKDEKYGILPLPSTNGGKSFGYVDPDKVNYILCPSYTTTAEGAGAVIAALSAACYQSEAEILLSLVRNNARDNGTLLVSHLIFSAPAWDFEY